MMKCAPPPLPPSSIQLNRERREIQADMQETAFAKLERFDPRDNYSLVVFEPDWHPGVVGLVAAKLKDRFHRPTIVFARGKDGELKGSGRSIATLHLRDALDLVAKRHANLIGKFGGHAAAAGLTIAEIDLRQFRDAFEQVSRSLLSLADLAHVVETDGELAANEATVAVALCLQEGVWGKDFPAPLFHGEFDVISQRIVAEMHVKSILRNNSQEYDSIQFFTTDPLPERIRTTYRLDLNEYNGSRALQLVLEHWEAA
jgi:single-stranded-DNA-specific exonuclease